jgi:hypothetical protein
LNLSLEDFMPIEQKPSAPDRTGMKTAHAGTDLTAQAKFDPQAKFEANPSLVKRMEDTYIAAAVLPPVKTQDTKHVAQPVTKAPKPGSP